MFLLVFGLLVLAGCGSQELRPDDESPPEAAAASPPVDDRNEVALLALSLLGRPYAQGGSSPETGFDCSGFVNYVYLQAERLRLPRTSYQLATVGDEVAPHDLAPGDLVFYNTQRRDYSHVGIYLGDGRFVHAPSSGGVVRVEDMRGRYWARRFNGARRVASCNTASC